MDSIWKKLYIFVCMEDRHESIEKVFSAIKSGDQRAFERVFRMFYVPLCDYAARFSGSRRKQRMLCKIFSCIYWRSRVEIEVQDSVKSYLFTSVRFRALNVLKHKMVERKHGALLTEFIEGLQRSDYSEEEMQQIEQIKKVLQELPIQCRVVFTMSCLEGKKYKDIANELGISVNTVKSHVMKAYKDIRARVGENTSPILFFIACKSMDK